MAFRYVLDGVELVAPDGAMVGVTGEDRGAQGALLAAARAGASVIAHDHPVWSPLGRRQQMVDLESARRQGKTIVVATWDEALIRECDEVWWVEGNTVRAQGAPSVVWPAYLRAAAETLRVWGKAHPTSLRPAFRAGDGRARLLTIEPLDGEGRVTQVWQSGAPASIRVLVEFAAPVESPVVGVMIRTRVGMEVYGTNTELEALPMGPVAAGDRREILFAFHCRLCANAYTITAASHDPDGVWHDWLEDAVAVSVSGTRYTAGVADLAARVTVKAF